MRLPFKLKKLLLIILQSNRIIIKLVIIDQITKWLCIAYLRVKPGLMLKVTSFLDVVYSWNYGISFGILRNYYQYSNRIFLVTNSAIVLYLWYILLRCNTVISFIGYSFVIGGAVGNILDRLINGAVFDFIYFHYKNYGLPIFNLADSFISIGVIILLYDYYKTKKIVEKIESTNYDLMKIEAEAEKIRKHSYDNDISVG